MYFSNTGANLPTKPVKKPNVAMSPAELKNADVPPAEAYNVAKRTNIIMPIKPKNNAEGMA